MSFLLFHKKQKGIISNKIDVYEDKLEELCSNLFNSTGFSFYLDKNIDSNNGGSTCVVNASHREVYVGWGDAVLTNDIKQVFANAVFSAHHERQHIQQFFDCQNGNAGNEVFYCHMSRNDNKNYYMQNYNLDYNELDADRCAIQYSLCYLIEVCPEIDAIESMKTCLKSKKSMYSDWESEIDKIQTIDDFDKYLFEPYEKKLLATRKDRFNTKDDEFNVFLNEHREPLNRCGDLRYDTIFASDDYNNTDCDKFVAAISKELHPEYADFYKNCRAYHDLSLKQIVKDWRKTHKTKAEERAEKIEQQFGYLNERPIKSADDLDLSDQIDSL